MNPPIVARSLVSLMITALLLLSGCEGMMSTESNPPAVVPNPQPGAPLLVACALCLRTPLR